MLWSALFKGTEIYSLIAAWFPAWLVFIRLIIPILSRSSAEISVRLVLAAALLLYPLAAIGSFFLWAARWLHRGFPWWDFYLPFAQIASFGLGAWMVVRVFSRSLGWKAVPIFDNNSSPGVVVGTRRYFDVPLWFFGESLLKALLDLTISVVLVVVLSLLAWNAVVELLPAGEAE